MWIKSRCFKNTLFGKNVIFRSAFLSCLIPFPSSFYPFSLSGNMAESRMDLISVSQSALYLTPANSATFWSTIYFLYRLSHRRKSQLRLCPGDETIWYNAQQPNRVQTRFMTPKIRTAPQPRKRTQRPDRVRLNAIQTRLS